MLGHAAALFALLCMHGRFECWAFFDFRSSPAWQAFFVILSFAFRIDKKLDKPSISLGKLPAARASCIFIGAVDHIDSWESTPDAISTNSTDSKSAMERHKVVQNRDEFRKLCVWLVHFFISYRSSLLLKEIHSSLALLLLLLFL